jgi:elongation factor G
VQVILVDGKSHEVDSSRDDFEIAASLAFQDGFHRAEPILLEPIMRVEVHVPQAYVGNIINDFAGRRGRVEQLDTLDGRLHQVSAMVPLSEMLGYATLLRSLTSGRGIFTMQLDHYAPMPQQLTEMILLTLPASNPSRAKRR